MEDDAPERVFGSLSDDDPFERAAGLPWWMGIGMAFGVFWVLDFIADNPMPGSSPISWALGILHGVAVSLKGLAPLAILGFVGYGRYRHYQAQRDRILSEHFRSNLGAERATGSDPRAPHRGSDDTSASYCTSKASSQAHSETAPNSQGLRTDVWNLDLLRAIEWKRFEEVCAAYFEICGFQATTQTHGADGGVDILLKHSARPGQVDSVVQCKQRVERVHESELRYLRGSMADHGADRGIFVTTYSFHPSAIRYAEKSSIFTLDGEQLLQRFLVLTAEQQAQLVEVATEGDFLIPTCAKCGRKMEQKVAKKGGRSFWGCTSRGCGNVLSMSKRSRWYFGD